jgi:hypothetical protein
MGQQVTAPEAGELYGAYYYRTGCGSPYVRNEGWLGFFDGIAARIVEDIQPGSVLDAGCAMGFLVERLRGRGVDAHGIDVSEYALGQADESVKPYCALRSVTAPLERRYDLVVCIEVLEHLPGPDAESAVRVLCDATDQVLFSSTPFDYAEATHFNVRPPEYWAGLFARHGFFRDPDFNAAFLTPWAVLFRKARQPVHRLVGQYERRLWLLLLENHGTRELTLKQRTELERLENGLREAAGQRDAAQQRVRELEQALAEAAQGLAQKEQASAAREAALAEREQAAAAAEAELAARAEAAAGREQGLAAQELAAAEAERRLAEKEQLLLGREQEFAGFLDRLAAEQLARLGAEHRGQLAEWRQCLAGLEQCWAERLQRWEQACTARGTDIGQAIADLREAHARGEAALHGSAQEREQHLRELLNRQQAELDERAVRLREQAEVMESLSAQLTDLRQAYAACTGSRAWRFAHAMRHWLPPLAPRGEGGPPSAAA